VRPLVRLSLVVAAAVWAPHAAAVEKEHHIAVAGGPALLGVDDRSGVELGAGAAVYYTYGLTDAFNLLVEGSSSAVGLNEKLDNPDTPHTRPATVSSLGAGAAYVLDVLRWVPYGGILATGYYLGGGTIDKGLAVLGAQLALGLDYKFNFNWAIGVAYRQHMLLTKMSTYPSFSQLFFKIEYSWGR
jgi:opacity protein-like surface antigen